jgi:hypothetical protein
LLLQQEIEVLSMRVSNSQLFPQTPTLKFYCHQVLCDCGADLMTYKTRTKSLSTLHIGKFKAHETLKVCHSCRKKYPGEGLATLAPHRSSYGFNLIVHIGMASFVYHKGNQLIQQELFDKNIEISQRQVGYLAKKFIIYLAIAHRESQSKVKDYMESKGGYILHLDGTCEGNEPHIFSAIDSISNIVLDNQKMATGNSSCISTMLFRIKLAYGKPLAFMSDMKSSISHAIEKVFPGVHHYICHYHFLRDIGKDLFEHEHTTIRRHIKTLRTRTTLRKTARELKNIIYKDDQQIAALQDYIKTHNV